MATFVISKRLNGDYKYELCSRKGKTILTSNSFELRFEAEEEIKRLQEHIEQLFFMKFKSASKTTGSKFYFKVILEGKEIAVSRKYSTQLMMEKGISEILKWTAQAEYLDFSLPNDVFV